MLAMNLAVEQDFARALHGITAEVRFSFFLPFLLLLLSEKGFERRFRDRLMGLIVGGKIVGRKVVVRFREIVEGNNKNGLFEGEAVLFEKSWSEWIVVSEAKLNVQGNKYTLGKCGKLKDYFWKILRVEKIYRIIIRKGNVFDFLI